MAKAGAVAMGTFGVAAVKGAGDFEETMSKSVALAGLLPEELDRVNKALLEMGPAMGKSPQELAEAFYFASSAGLDTEKALAAVTESAKASAAGLGETKTVVNAATSVMNAYSLSADKAGRVTDTLVATVKEGKGESEDLAASIGKVIPVASQMGVSFEEVGASLAIMTRIGLDADESATALRGILIALIKPSEQATAAFAAMGTSADEIRKAIKDRGLAAVLVEMMDALGGNEEALVAIFPEVRGLTGVLATAGNQGEEYVKTLRVIQGALGITDDAFAEASDTFAFKARQAKASFDVLRIQVGNALLPALKDLADWFVAHLPEIQQFVEQGIKKFQKALEDNRQTLLDAAKGIGELGTAFMTFGGWVISNKVALVAALLAIGAALVAFSGPVGIVAGILGIASALGILKGAAIDTKRTLSDLLDVAIAARSESGFMSKWFSESERAQIEAAAAGQIIPKIVGQAQQWAAEDLSRNIPPWLEAKKPPWGASPTPDDINLFNDYAGAVGDATDAIAAQDQALIDLTAAISASGLSAEEYAHSLSVTAAFMDTFNLSGEEMLAIFQRSGLAAGEFAQRLEALTALQEVTQDAEDAASAVNDLYNQFNNLYAKPSREAAEQNLAIDELRLERARLLEAAGEHISEREQRAIDKIEDQIDAIQREIDVRRADAQVQEDLFVLHDKMLPTDEALKVATEWITLAMDDASAKALAMRDELFWTTLSIGGWRREMDAWIASLSSSPGIPSFQHGGVMPYTGLAHLEKGEEVRAAGSRSQQTFYGPVTVVAPAGSGNSLADLERWLR